jgi:predicted AlkP superfamily pyrophosphatase or phosphodiesterase
MRSKNFLIIAVLLAFLASGVQLLALPKPKLAVIIVVDQMRADYLTRQQKLFTGGFRRLLDGGLQFTETYHDHAVTETGVGHATIATGSYPAHNGIIANEWWDRTALRWTYCVEDSNRGIAVRPGSPGRSPDLLRRPVFGDWLHQKSQNSLVYAITGKDRSSILMAGFSGQAAYWYYPNDGTIVTSTYYRATYPAWVDSFNNERPADDYFTGIWDRLLPREKYSGQDSVIAESDGKNTTFPHDFNPLPNESPNKYYDKLRYTPFADQLLLRFARDLVINEKLGADDDPDLLMIGCSAGDYIGHRYGPGSQEIQDHYLRLDGYLGTFFAFLDSTVGVDRYIVALTGDHGVAPLPEELKTKGLDAGRINGDTLAAAIKRLGSSLASELGCSTNVVVEAGDAVILDYTCAKSKGHDEAWLRQTMADKIKHLPFVVDAFTREELSSTEISSRPYIQFYRNNYYADRSPDIMIRFKEHWIISDVPYGTSHETPYDYDRHIPLIFYGNGIKPGIDTLRASTVDIAPTMSELIGIAFPATCDGKSLMSRLKR